VSDSARSGPSLRLDAVILAGGSGQRFWPLSRELNPKQLLGMFGTESLIAQAVHRVLPALERTGGKAWIVTNERLFDELRNHLTAQADTRLHHVDYLKEPLPRNTAPAIALAAAVLSAEDPQALMVVLPSDHLLEEGATWDDCLESAALLAADDHLVTIGIAPTRAETGYGYILGAEDLPAYDVGAAKPRRVDRFVEKPDADTAERFVESGRYFWNAGIFVMKAATVLSELEAATAEGAHIVRVVRDLAARPRDEWGSEAAIEAFGGLPALSIDYALMEHTERAAVIPAPLTWSDVGSLLSLETLAEPDDLGTVRVGRGVDVDTRDSIVYTTDRLVATLGVSDLIVVDTADATLVAAKDRAQDVRQIVEALKAAGADEVVQPKVSLRPWGSWTLLMKTDGFQIKSIDVLPGKRLSLQSHESRSEHWVVVSGSARVECDTVVHELSANESVYLPAGCVHRLENPAEDLLRVIEVAVGDYLGEDDITRYDDDWGREGGHPGEQKETP